MKPCVDEPVGKGWAMWCTTRGSSSGATWSLTKGSSTGATWSTTGSSATVAVGSNKIRVSWARR